MKEKEFDYVRSGRIATAIALGIGLFVYFFGGVIASAVSSSTNTQVTETYYTGIPTKIESYEDAYLRGDNGVRKVTYTTRSIGRLQWGEQNADGTYDVYYDAKDIHTMAAYLNESWESYEELYNKYVDAYNAVNN